MTLQCFKKELSYEVDVLHAHKHESFLQVDNIIFDGLSWACPKTKVNMQCFCDTLKRK